jgi:hypothetical protein
MAISIYCVHYTYFDKCMPSYVKHSYRCPIEYKGFPIRLYELPYNPSKCCTNYYMYDGNEYGGERLCLNKEHAVIKIRDSIFPLIIGWLSIFIGLCLATIIPDFIINIFNIRQALYQDMIVFSTCVISFYSISGLIGYTAYKFIETYFC